jgi:hypothetical protein
MDDIPIGYPISEGIVGTNSKQDITAKLYMHVPPGVPLSPPFLSATELPRE